MQTCPAKRLLKNRKQKLPSKVQLKETANLTDRELTTR